MSWQDRALAEVREQALKQNFYRAEQPISSCGFAVAATFGIACFVNLVLTNFFSANAGWSWTLSQPALTLSAAAIGFGWWFRERSAYREYCEAPQIYDAAATSLQHEKQLESAK